MKYLLIFFIILSFIGPVVEDHKSMGSILKDSVYNYVTCLDNSLNYLVDTFPSVEKFVNIPYDIAYNSVMKDRVLEKHLVLSGETLDDIIKSYNTNIDNIEDFRKVIYKENQDVVSKDYQVKSGEYILIPCEKLISKN